MSCYQLIITITIPHKVKDLFEEELLHVIVNVQFQKISILPHRRDWNFLGVGGSVKPKKFKEMYEALLEFPEGWGVLEIKPSVGEVWIFSEITSFKNSKQSLETKPPQFYKVSLLNWSLQ